MKFSVPFLILILSLIILSLFIIRAFSVWNSAKRKKQKLLKKIPALLNTIKNLAVQQKILEYDKVLHVCLQSAGYTGTTGNMMKKHGKKFVNENAIWKAHKARNRIAHEINVSFSEKEQKRIEQSFLREINKFL